MTERASWRSRQARFPDLHFGHEARPGSKAGRSAPEQLGMGENESEAD